MLLQVNPTSLFARTHSGETLLDLATTKATKSHPNYALINDIQSRLKIARDAATSVSSASAAMDRYNVESGRISSIDDSDQGTDSLNSASSSTVAPIARGRQPKRKRKVTADDEETQNAIRQADSEQANLLLHFSRHMNDEVAKLASV